MNQEKKGYLKVFLREKIASPARDQYRDNLDAIRHPNIKTSKALAAVFVLGGLSGVYLNHEYGRHNMNQLPPIEELQACTNTGLPGNKDAISFVRGKTPREAAIDITPIVDTSCRSDGEALNVSDGVRKHYGVVIMEDIDGANIAVAAPTDGVLRFGPYPIEVFDGKTFKKVPAEGIIGRVCGEFSAGVITMNPDPKATAEKKYESIAVYARRSVAC